MSTPNARLAMQIGGRGFLEAHPPNDVTGARFEGRFVIYGMMSHGSPIFGDDVSLFERDCAAQHGLGPGSAHFVAMRSGFGLESFHTGDDEFVGHLYARTSARTRLRIYFDPAPDGSRSFEDRDSFTRGQLIGTYRAEEFFQLDARAGVFNTRVSYTLIESSPFTFMDTTVDLAEVAPSMTDLSAGHAPEDAPRPIPIPHGEEPFTDRGPGVFAQRFPVGGAWLTVD
ncbi:hypothetical protein [Geodermatophilus sabuli]|uniref:Uncharacterized protein n=1 Tax=Geodermatophilus sabuli TaxID=1564158 RepID=A0A285EBZ9_9ACTN|nr:hypothetical protein [Geodermatophilus sabuli]MBB3084162.1 hypothetical protein [Geodermatophilus sabuli]SNX96565.1 hypothetical protein SAMN06893097_104280 [Geodermatophilus sabuli]